MPNALMEAMALGVVCIATNCPSGGPRYLINNGINGYLININSKKELSELIKKILKDINENELDEISKKAIQSMNCLKESNINQLWVNYIEKVLKDN